MAQAREVGPVPAVPPGRRFGARLGRWPAVIVAAAAKLKLLLVFGSALLSVAVYALAFGWVLAAGFVALLAVHELGHVFAMRIKGFPASAPYFIPMLGAVIFAKRNARDPVEDAFIGAGGPVAGTLASWLALGLFVVTHAQVFAALALLGCLIHLFNLVPVTPLDGGRILSFLRWWAWIPALLGLVFVFTYRFGYGGFAPPANPIDWLILFAVLATLRGEWQRDKARAAAERAAEALLAVAPGERRPPARARVPRLAQAVCLGTWTALAVASACGLLLAMRLAQGAPAFL